MNNTIDIRRLLIYICLILCSIALIEIFVFRSFTEIKGINLI